MSSGMLTKQADQLTARFLNDVNDASVGGALVSLPAGITPPQLNATQPGDRIVLDDVSAAALSDTSVGTLYGGVYMYVVTLSSATKGYVRGCIAFFRATDIGASTTSLATDYIVTSDPQPMSSVPTYIAGIFISSPTAGNACWIQVAGAASVQFESSSITAATAGLFVSAKIGGTIAGQADCGASPTSTTLAALLGVAVGTPATSTISTVMLTRGNFCGRI